MTKVFEFVAPDRVVFGVGRSGDAGSLVRDWGERCLVFTGSSQALSGPVLDSLGSAGLLVEVVTVAGEPSFDVVREALAVAIIFGPDQIVAIGGGSVIDTGKAVAMLLANGGDPIDYAEVIGRGLAITEPSIPFTALPTTAGAGAEATRNAVLVDRQKKAKVSLRSHLMLPRLVIIDPALTIGLPPHMTAATGLDALSQLIEPLVSIKANPVTDALCRAGIPRIARSLARVCEQPGDLDARSDMSLAAWWSGMALANAGLGAVHGFAAAIGGMVEVSHGLVCARFLAPVCEANIAALRVQGDPHDILSRYRDIAVLLTGNDDATEDDGVLWLKEWIDTLPLPKLPALEHPNEVIDAAVRSSSMKGNPVALGRERLLDALAQAAGIR